MKIVKGKVESAEEVYVLDTKDAARFIGLSESNLRQMRAKGEGPVYAKVERRVVYPIQDLRDFINGCIVK